MNNNVATWFELPVTDMQRAKAFYQEVLQASFKDETMSGYQMAIFNADEGSVSGMLILGEQYQPSQTGAVVYFNGGENLSMPLDRAVKQGSSVLVPKTPIHDGECGYFALFSDSEGNRVGLYSPS
ncbi:VOC family protein [Methylomonas sp. LL1]|uniref:VOC family protein n=1 Tax=Methylomonas sp. LL1 TaxID=2785785 RepID=UPI0018C3C5AE|nr:VOC family protein [Methylomonas sp. LL1]QPK62420.1 VOC family protein [Methylomonas sp. LL1]